MPLFLSPAVRQVWAAARVRRWPEPVVLATFNRFAGDRVAAFAGRVGVRDPNAFVAFVTEGDECSLTAPESVFSAWRLRGRALEVVKDLSALTVDVAMPPDLVGFFAPAAARLAAASIPIIPQCGYRTDHLLVPRPRAEEAVAVLEALILAAQKEEA